MLHRITTAVTQNDSTTHPSSFKVGGLIHSRHDKTRDSLGCLACNSNPPMFAMNLKSTYELNPRSIQIVIICWFEALGQNYWSYPRCYLLKKRRKLGLLRTMRMCMSEAAITASSVATNAGLLVHLSLLDTNVRDTMILARARARARARAAAAKFWKTVATASVYNPPPRTLMQKFQFAYYSLQITINKIGVCCSFPFRKQPTNLN